MDKKPRVLIFSLAYFPFIGGAEIAVKEITDRLSSPTRSYDGTVGAPTHAGVGVDFDLITYKFKKEWDNFEKIGNINVYRVDSANKIFFVFKALLLAKKLHKENNYSVAWSIMAAYAGFSALFFKFFNPKIPFLLTLQEGDSEEHILKRVGIFYPLWKLIFKKADRIQAVSNYLADFAHRHGAVCPIEVVPNGVYLDKFKSQNFSPREISRRETNLKTIITTSRLVYKNGIDILIRAMAEVKKDIRCPLDIECPKIKLLILGSGPEEQNLKKLAKNLDLSNEVIFMGHIEPDKIPGYLGQTDIFVRPSRSEGLGNSFLEAMAARIPVIGTPVGGILDFLKNRETGLFSKPGDHKDLAEKILEVLSDENLYNKLSVNGRKLVEEKYSWEDIYRKMEQLFRNLFLFPKTKLLLATGIYPPDIGGPATYAVLLEKEMPKRGIGVKIAAYGQSGVSRSIPKGLRHFIFFLKCFIAAFESDVILAQDTISAGLPALCAAKLSGRKFLVRVPGDYVWEQSVQRFGVKDSIDSFQNKKYGWRVEFLRSVQKFVVGNADVVITPSKYFGNLVSKWVKDPSKVHTIYNGIDLNATRKTPSFAHPPLKATEWHSKATEGRRIHPNDTKQTLYPIPYTLKTIVSVGRLVPWKGFGFLIELMKDLPVWKLVIIGSGPDREALELQVTSFKLQDRVEFTGAISREKVLEYLSQSGIFVLNTMFESFSFQVVEAMSLGLPVITTNIGNLSEIIENGVDGMLVEPNNRDQFLSAINKLDKDENFRKSISERARIKAEKFSIENTISELIKLL